jgi:carbamoyl-phosphate synthase small subunit
VREFTHLASNWRSKESIQHYLGRCGVPVIYDLDTRALVRHLRRVGALRGIVATDGTPAEKLVAEACLLPPMAGQELASRVTSPERYQWSLGSILLDEEKRSAKQSFVVPRPAEEDRATRNLFTSGPQTRDLNLPLGRSAPPSAASACWTSTPEVGKHRVVAYDFGIKQSILRLLVDRGCAVTVVPAHTSAEDVLALQPDGVFLSNGPGDPEPITYAVANIRRLLGHVPIFGICLGHQLCGLALGGRTYKLKFGHHGSNHPVKNLLTGKIEITAQNHGFCVDPDSLPSGEVEITHLNLNDHTNEGLRHRTLPLFSVQYHPEASPGPHDARYLFDNFISLMNQARPR